MYFPLLWGSVLVFDLLYIALCLFWLYNHLKEEETAGCFIFNFLQMSCYCKCSVALPDGAMCVIVVFPDHTHLPFGLCFCVHYLCHF